MYSVYLFEAGKRYYMQGVPDEETLQYYFTGILALDTKGARLDARNLTITYPDGSFYFAYRGKHENDTK